MNISELYKLFLKHSVICTDSRSVIRDSIFFSLKGENFNGNKFAKQALKNGCRFAVVDEEEYYIDGCILVKDVKVTLQKLATYHRKQLSIPIIGITGTNGKTTNKELLHCVLSSQYNCYATKGNLNNQIGVPLSILEINNTHEIAIIEMGASEIGEIEKLSNISQPNTGIITNVGLAHLEGFGNLKGVVKTKTELYNFIEKTNGTVFVNSEDRILLEKSNKIKRVRFGKGTTADFNAQLIEEFPFISIKIGDTSINSNLIGEFQFYNILAACAIGNFFGITTENLKKSIEIYKPKNNRTEIVETNKNYIILDAYNANPSSMNSMIESFSKLERNRKLCILGEMRELAEYSKKEHISIIEKMTKLDIETIFIGEEFTKISDINSYKDTVEFLKEKDKFKLNNRTILIKGSRGIKLEDLIKHL